jgi:hypothetical protein
MAGVAGYLLIYFRRRGWLGNGERPPSGGPPPSV